MRPMSHPHKANEASEPFASDKEGISMRPMSTCLSPVSHSHEADEATEPCVLINETIRMRPMSRPHGANEANEPFARGQ